MCGGGGGGRESTKKDSKREGVEVENGSGTWVVGRLMKRKK